MASAGTPLSDAAEAAAVLAAFKQSAADEQAFRCMMRDMLLASAPAVRAAVSAGHPVGVRRPNAASCADRASCAVRDPHGLAGGLQLARPAAP